jgi:membrane-associated phospholipid phosphatase
MNERRKMALNRAVWIRIHSLLVGCLAVTVLIGVVVTRLSLNDVECVAISELQSLAQSTVGIPFFMVLTYMGDFNLWAAFSAAFFIYAFFKSRQNLGTSVTLIVYLTLVTASTYLLKEAFARPRPDCAEITLYGQETLLGIPVLGGLLSDLSSFSYPSGHVSRATGSLIVLSGKRSIVKTALIVAAVSALSVSRIVLGTHYPTDVVGAVPLALAMVDVTGLVINSMMARREVSTKK